MGIDIFDVRHLDQAPNHIPLSERRFEQFSPDWSLLAVIDMDGAVNVWDVNTASKEFTIPLPNLNAESVKFSPNGQFLALFTSDNSVRLWNVDTVEQVHVWTNDQSNNPIWAFSPDSSTFAITTSSTTQPHFIQLWDIETGQVVADLEMEASAPIISHLTFSPDNTMLAVSSNLNTTVWDMRTHTKFIVLDMVFTFDWAFGSVFSPDSRLLAAFGRQRIYIWDVTTRRQNAIIDGLGSDVIGVQFGTDSSWLFSTDWSDSDSKPHVRLWDTTSGRSLREFVNEQFPVLSHDGTLLATNEYGGLVIIRAVQ
jgi:WD40 repeat protein